MNFDLTPEQERIQSIARQFAEEEVAPISREADEHGVFPSHLVPRMGELGLFAIPSVTAYDPTHYAPRTTHTAYALVCEELGRVDSSVRGFLTVHVGLVAG